MKRILFGLLGILAVLIAIVLIRTFSYGGAPQGLPEVTLPEPPPISAEAGAAHLSEAIRFQTITYKAGDPTPEAAGPWDALHTWMEVTYPRVHETLRLEKVAGWSLLYTWQGSDPALDPIILMAHQDVVPVNEGTLEYWTGAPFDGDIVDGYVYGRGALDDKGAMVAIMEAAEALIGTGFQPQRTVHFMFGHDEEVSGAGASAMVDLLDSRGVRAEMVLDEGFFVIEDSPLTGGPFGFIGVAEKGYATLRITATAQGGHSSSPPRNTANVKLARAIIALEENQMPADFSSEPVADLFRAAAADMGFMGRMAFANQWLFSGMIESQLAASGGDAMVRTTTAPTVLEGSIKENVLPQRSSVLVNFRVHPNDTIPAIVKHVEEQIADIDGVSVAVNDVGIGSEASPVSPANNKPYAVLAKLADRVGGGVSVGPGLVFGATDARWASKISGNVYRFVPSSMPMADLAGFHGTNERLSVENMGRMAEGYAQLILAMDSE